MGNITNVPDSKFRKMRVIPKPKVGTRGVLKTDGTNPDIIFVTGKGNIDYICGKCGRLICKSVFPNEALDIVFLCPECNSYNELDDSPQIDDPLFLVTLKQLCVEFDSKVGFYPEHDLEGFALYYYATHRCENFNQHKLEEVATEFSEGGKEYLEDVRKLNGEV